MTVPERVPITTSLARRLALRYECGGSTDGWGVFEVRSTRCRSAVQTVISLLDRLTARNRRVSSRLQTRLITSLRNQLCTVVHEANEVSSSARSLVAPAASRYSQQSAFFEILALTSVFPDVYYEPETKNLVVITEPIELVHDDGILHLGTLAIALEQSKSNDRRMPTVYIRKTDDTECSHDDYVHPHVQNGGLCQGAARNAINNALLDGRILDLFMVVDVTLKTYVPNDNYRTIEHWDAPPPTTRDCDNEACETMYNYEDEGGECAKCGRAFCDDCIMSCPDCGRRLCETCAEWACFDDGSSLACNQCIETCSCCGLVDHKDIMERCEESGSHVCVNCLCRTPDGSVYGPDHVSECKSCNQFFYYADIENGFCQECSDAQTEGD